MKIADLLTRINILQTNLQAQITALDALVGTGSIVTLLSYQQGAGTGTRALTSYADYPGTHDLTIVKKFSGTVSKLVVFGAVGGFASVGNTKLTVGLSFGGVDHDIGWFYFNAAGTHQYATCQDDTFASLAAGTQTGRLRWKSDSTNQINTDGNDTVRLTLLEVLL